MGQTVPVDAFKPNPWGIYQVHGNIWEWTEDCWNDSYYKGVPTDGSAWTAGDCGSRVLKGGSWNDDPRYLRSAIRYQGKTNLRVDVVGFRVGRILSGP